jgi:hypothetical protein
VWECSPLEREERDVWGDREERGELVEVERTDRVVGVAEGDVDAEVNDVVGDDWDNEEEEDDDDDDDVAWYSDDGGDEDDGEDEDDVVGRDDNDCRVEDGGRREESVRARTGVRSSPGNSSSRVKMVLRATSCSHRSVCGGCMPWFRVHETDCGHTCVFATETRATHRHIETLTPTVAGDG